MKRGLIVGFIFLLAIISIANVGAVCNGVGESKEIYEGDVYNFGELPIGVVFSDETNLKLSSRIILSGKKVSLDNVNPSEIVNIIGKDYTIELISTSDNAATIAVKDSSGIIESKEVAETNFREINGMAVGVFLADETNLNLSSTIIIGYKGVSLDSDSPLKSVAINGKDYTIELISTSDGATTLNVVCSEVSKIAPDEILLTSYNSSKTITIEGVNYNIELISASDTAATITVTDGTGATESKEVSEGASKIIGNLQVYVKTADETNLQFTAKIKVSKILEEVKEIKDIGSCDNGCALENKCYPLGYRKSGKYCSEDLEFVVQLDSDNACENNFECKSNVCVSGECVSEGFIKKIINWFKKLFGGE